MCEYHVLSDVCELYVQSVVDVITITVEDELNLFAK